MVIRLKQEPQTGGAVCDDWASLSFRWALVAVRLHARSPRSWQRPSRSSRSRLLIPTCLPSCFPPTGPAQSSARPSGRPFGSSGR